MALKGLESKNKTIKKTKHAWLLQDVKTGNFTAHVYGPAGGNPIASRQNTDLGIDETVRFIKENLEKQGFNDEAAEYDKKTHWYFK